jgi:hypothetical protein
MKTILVGKNKERYYLAKQTDGWVGFTQHLSATPIEVSSIAEGLALCNPDEISGLDFHLEEVPEIKTLLHMIP